MTVETGAVLHVPARAVPVPSHLSAEAQRALTMGVVDTVPYPALDDTDGWRAYVAVCDEAIMPMIAARVTAGDTASEENDVDGVRVHVATPGGAAPSDSRVYLD